MEFYNDGLGQFLQELKKSNNSDDAIELAEAIQTSIYSNSLLGKIPNFIDTYRKIYLNGKANNFDNNFLSTKEKANALKRVKTVIPDGYYLISDNINEFSNLHVDIIDTESGFYCILSFPIFKPDQMFNTFIFHPRPVLVRNNLILIEPKSQVLGIAPNGNEIFEIDQQTLKNECIESFGHMVCPYIAEYHTDLQKSCLYNLYKPNNWQSDLLSICPMYLLPKTQSVYEVYAEHFQFFFPNEISFEVECPGKARTENLDLNTMMVKIDQECEIVLNSSRIRPARMFLQPSSDNPYNIRMVWFDSLKELEPYFPSSLSSPIDLTSLKTSLERFLYFNEKSNNTTLYQDIIIALCCLIFIIIIVILVVVCRKKKNGNDTSNP